MIVPRENLIFEDELDAAKNLIDILSTHSFKKDNTLIICSSLDSVFLVDEVAKKLKFDYEILFSESIYAPNNSECVVACVSETQEIVIIEELVKSFKISLDYIYGQGNRKYEENILKNIYKYRKGELLQNVENKNILLIDDGCESGLTTLACVKTLMNLGVKTITYATPLISSHIVENIRVLVDELFYVHNIMDFVSVDFYYKTRLYTKPETIMQILENSQYYLPLQKKEGEKTNAVLS